MAIASGNPQSTQDNGNLFLLRTLPTPNVCVGGGGGGGG